MGRRNRLAIVNAAIAVCLMGMAVASVALVAAARSESSGPEIVVDNAVVDQWERSLAPGLADLNALGSLPGLTGNGDARIRPCRIDSGALLDLGAGAFWTALQPGLNAEHLNPSVTPATAEGFQTIIRRLTDAGWTIVDNEENLDMDLPTGLNFDTVDMERRVGGTELRLSVQVFDDGVLAGIDFDGARDACRLLK